VLVNPNGWVQTFSGGKIWPLEPRVEDVRIEDIAHALSMICRYGGATRHFYSVSEHSVLVSYLVEPEFAREGLLHDAAEAYLGDVVRPLKRQDTFTAYIEAEQRLEAVIAQKFGLRTDPATHAAVKEFDDRILVDETRALMHTPELYRDRPWFQNLAPTDAAILCYPPQRAEMLFLLRFWELFPEHAPADFSMSDGNKHLL
jgi:hypothetical protein